MMFFLCSSVILLISHLFVFVSETCNHNLTLVDKTKKSITSEAVFGTYFMKKVMRCRYGNEKHTAVAVIFYTLKQYKGLSSFTLEGYTASTKNFDGFDFFNSLWLARYLKKCQNEITKGFSVGNTKINILSNQG